MYFLYSDENGFEIYETEEEARHNAQMLLDDTIAAGDIPNDDNRIFYGKILGCAEVKFEMVEK